MSLVENVSGLDLELDDQYQSQLAANLSVPLARRLPAVEAHLPDDVVDLFDDLLHNDRCGVATHGLEELRKRCLATFLAWSFSGFFFCLEGVAAELEEFTQEVEAVLLSIRVLLPDLLQAFAQGYEKRVARVLGDAFGDNLGELVLAHEICRRLDAARTDDTIRGIGSDGKSQVSVVYDELGTPVGIDTVIVSIQHDADKDLDVLEREVRMLVVAPAIEAHLPGATAERVLVNPSGRFVIGGPTADTGLSGRKLMVDTYGGLGPHGGGAFSGKDPSKVDRSGAYMARLIAKTVVDARLAEECHVAISYAIGKADPVAFHIDTFGTGQHPDWLLTDAARAVFPLRPAAIIERLGLQAPIYAKLSTYGHMGHGLSEWEWTLPFTDKLKTEVKDRAHQAATHQ